MEVMVAVQSGTLLHALRVQLKRRVSARRGGNYNEVPQAIQKKSRPSPSNCVTPFACKLLSEQGFGFCFFSIFSFFIFEHFSLKKWKKKHAHPNGGGCNKLATCLLFYFPLREWPRSKNHFWKKTIWCAFFPIFSFFIFEHFSQMKWKKITRTSLVAAVTSLPRVRFFIFHYESGLVLKIISKSIRLVRLFPHFFIFHFRALLTEEMEKKHAHIDCGGCYKLATCSLFHFPLREWPRSENRIFFPFLSFFVSSTSHRRNEKKTRAHQRWRL